MSASILVCTHWRQPITLNVPLEIGDGVNVDLMHFKFSLLSYPLEFTYRFTEPYLVSFNFFDPWWQRRHKLTYSFQLVPHFFFVSTDCDNFLLCVIKHRTALTNDFPVLNFYLSHTEIESSLLLMRLWSHETRGGAGFPGRATSASS